MQRLQGHAIKNQDLLIASGAISLRDTEEGRRMMLSGGAGGAGIGGFDEDADDAFLVCLI